MKALPTLLLGNPLVLCIPASLIPDYPTTRFQRSPGKRAFALRRTSVEKRSIPLQKVTPLLLFYATLGAWHKKGAA